MDKHVIASENAPAALGPYSAGITTGNLAFLSGQLGLDPTTSELAQGVVAQAEQALKNIEALLAAAGATFGNVVKTTVFLADIADFDAVNEVYGAHFTEPYPARSAVQVAALPKGALVEIECIVAL